MKIKLSILFMLVCLGATAQKEAAFGCGEKLEIMISYKAKLLTSDVAKVTLSSSCTKLDGRDVYHIEGRGRVQPFFRWFFDLNDTYHSWLDASTLRPLKFTSDLREGDYHYTSTVVYNWSSMVAESRYRNLKRPNTETKKLPLTTNSFDAIALFYNLRSMGMNNFTAGQARTLQVVLDDTVRSVQYKLLRREERDVKDLGRFKTLKFSCQLVTSTGESFADGTEFYLWVSDDRNKVPLYIESPIRVGSITGRITRMENLKYPLDSKIK